MKLHFSLIFLFILSISIYGQKKEILSKQDKAVAEHFKKEYKKKNYKKFEGKIVTTDSYVQFDNKIFYYNKYDKSDKIISNLLNEGLIYPQLLTDYQMEKFLDETTDRTQKRFLKLQKDPRAGFDVSGAKLSNAAELSFLSSNPTVKRFKFSSKDMRISGSRTYFIELTNKNANNKTSLEDFIKGSKLTYIYQD